MHSGNRRSALQPPDKLGSGHRVMVWSYLCGACRRNHFLKLKLAAMASKPGLLHHLPSSVLSCIPSSSLPSSSSSCIFPRSNRCIVPQLVAGELRRSSGAKRVEALRAAGSEVAAPAPVEEENGPNLPCGTCNSKGWLLCDFCKGQKTNVQVRANKFYRRCPSCRAVGVVICPQCKVFKCVTFPDGVDGY